MNSESDDSLNSQLEIEIKKNALKKKIDDYLETEIQKDLSSVQKKQLKKYRVHLRLIPIKKLTETEITSIDNHIKSAIYNDKQEIMEEIKDLEKKYTPIDKSPSATNELKHQKIRILKQLEKELNFLPDKYLSKADSDYFTKQLELLRSNKYVLRENLLKQVNDSFLKREIGSYPYSYIDEVNKLRINVRRKPFIVSHKTRDKILKRLKKVTNDYKSFLGFKY
jgi:hypothetical protein